MAKKVRKTAKEINREFHLVSVSESLAKGNLITRLSAVIFGFGNIARGQIIRGLIFLLAEISFFVFLFQYGIGFLGDLVTLGTKEQGEVFNEAKQIYEYTAGDNSMLCLLYGIITLFIIAAFIFLWRASVKSAYEAQKYTDKGQKAPSFMDDIRSFFDEKMHKTLLTIPVLCLLLFNIMPLVFMISMAFTNYDRDHQAPGKLFDWVGLENFKKILDPSNGLGSTFWHVLGWTIIWAIFATFLNYILGMILAIVINRKDTKLKGMWRFIFVLSIAVPQFVSLLVMRTLLQPDGAINVLFKELGWITESLPFWTDPTWARVMVIVINLWVGIPYTMLSTTGILQNIPAELYESAKVDGANAVVTFFKITLPYMIFIMTPSLISSFVNNINNFNVIYLLTKGAPASLSYYKGTAGKTDLLVTWLYKLTVDFKDYNLAAVIGILTFVISATLSLVVYRRTGAYNNEEAFR